MVSIPSKSLSQFWETIQGSLFFGLSEMLGEALTEQHKRLAALLEISRIENRVPTPLRLGFGRPCHDSRLSARAFFAKAVYNMPTTEVLIESLRTDANLRKICGWSRREDVPSSATLSRHFKKFAHMGLCDIVHRALVDEYVTDYIVMHESLDSTEVIARERPVKREKPPKLARKRGRPAKNEHRPEPEPKRLDIQLTQSADEAIEALSTDCDWGTKIDTGGHKHSWKGFKAHINWADDMIPLCVVTTSASVHDSQVAIPIMRRTAERVRSCYNLMDSAYDAPQIRTVSEQLGHVPIIDPNPRRGGMPQEKLFDPAATHRYKERTNAERGNARLKDEFGLRFVRVRGHAKAHLHIMFGIVALFAAQLLHPLTST